ncbi:4-alpha-glucanotransferase [Guyparkeria sp.]|uniref:4-alpha-glucanotransferase n=1 Tax=Guyparkeria sp. TaxID=2035736 RepID=UPI0039708881
MRGGTESGPTAFLPCEAPASVRRAGLLLPVFSLPRPGFGADARSVIRFLERAGLTVWQVLPLGPTHADGSPYQCLSSFALNPVFLDLEDLEHDASFRNGVPAEARRQGAGASGPLLEAFEAFARAESGWLDDYALFMAIKAEQGGDDWTGWPAPLRDRDPEALQRFRQAHEKALQRIAFEQFLLDRQWQSVRREASDHGIRLFGDLPIFVAGDSADVWANRDQFRLDGNGQPQVVAGVPPDYFSETGQRWGNPLFDYERMENDGFSWWKMRFARHLEIYDWVRIDHFRGLEAYWEIDAAAETASDGRWVPAPGDAILATLESTADGHLPLVAEDLGVITPEVTALRERFGLPGMKILQFAFDGGDDNPYRPSCHEPLSVVYTGTHDNDTTLGWWRGLDEGKRHQVRSVLADEQGIDPTMQMPDALVESALASRSGLAVIPAADFLRLGSEARINVPGTTEGNWRWQLAEDALTDALADRIRDTLANRDRLPDH